MEDFEQFGDQDEGAGNALPAAPPLEIPIRNEHGNETLEVIAFDPLDLPDVDDVIEVLIDQEATQMRWLRFAAAYFRLGRARDTEKLLVRVKGDYVGPVRGGAPQMGRRPNSFNPDILFSNDLEGRALVGNALAALYVHFAREHRLSARQNADREPELDKPLAILASSDGRMEELQSQPLLAKAEALLQTTDKYSNTERVMSITLTTRAEIQMEQYLQKLSRGGLSQTEIDKSLTMLGQTFQSALDLRPLCMRALFGRASILFLKGQYKEAKDLYSRAISRFPGADPGATRVALGLCFYELGQEGRAQECFERALELDPKSVDAQVCLAIIEMGLATDAERAAGDTAQELARNQERARRLRERANDKLRLAYDLDKWNPLLKVHLANNFFYSQNRDFKRIGDLAKEAFNHTTSKQIKAEACYISARNYHAQGDTRNAATLYSKALDHWALFPLARYGHAQMELTQAKPDLSAALRAIQLVVDTPEGRDDEDCLLMVGALHRMMHNTEAALQNLRRVTEKNPYRADAWLQQALLEQSKYRQSLTSAEEAIRCYDKAVAALRFNKEPVPFELYNNVGALKFRCGDFKGSMVAFDQAVKERGGEIYDSPGKIKLSMVTLVYNKARALEGLGKVEEAERLFNELVQLAQYYPGEVHVDAQLRLAALAAARGDFETAIESFIKPMSTTLPKASVADFYSFYGDVEIARAKAAESTSAKAFAENKFKKILDINTNDPYARLSLANLMVEESQNMMHRKEDREKGEGYLREAAQYYRTILKRNPTNVFAASGLGSCHAIRGRLKTSHLILDKVREFADAICPSAWINLAHVQIQEGAFEQAASLYDQCSKRFFDNRDPEILMYVANARYLTGAYSEARAAVLNALKICPHDDAFWFASANIDEAEAYQRLEIEPKLRTKASVEKAMSTLQRALNVYEWLMSKAVAVAKTRAEQKKDDAEATSLAKRAHVESLAPLQVPHLPSPPTNEANGHAIVRPNDLLLARARVAKAELIGESPSPQDVALVSKADALKHAKELKEADALKAIGRRPDAMRAVNPTSAKLLSQTAVNRLAQLSSKRVDVIKEEMRKSETYLEAQRKIERKIEADRRRAEEVRLVELKRLEDEKRRKDEEEKKEQEKILQRQALLAKRNEELAQMFKDEDEEAEAANGARRSKRDRKKTQKMRESNQQSKRGSKRKEKAKKRKSDDEDKDDTSSSSSEEEEDEDDDEGSAEESGAESDKVDISPEPKEKPMAKIKQPKKKGTKRLKKVESSSSSSEDDSSEDDEEVPSEESEKITVAQGKVEAELRGLINDLAVEPDTRLNWFKEKCVELLGEEIMNLISKEWLKDKIIELFSQRVETITDPERQTKRVKVVDDDGDEAVAPKSKKNSRRVIDEDDSEDGEDGTNGKVQAREDADEDEL